METKSLIDKINSKDRFDVGNLLNQREHQGFKTSVTAFDEFGNALWTQQNQTVLGGALFVLEKLFNVRSSISVDTINNIMDINAAGSNKPGNYTADDIIQLWGIGNGGAGDALASVRDVKFYEREIAQKGQGASQMIPFRMTTKPLDGSEASQYTLRKEISGHYAYYGKQFEITPTIKALWKDGEDGEDGTEVPEDVYNTERADDIEVFVELNLKLNKKDVREWYEYNGEPEKCRVNTIGLFFARKYEVEPSRNDYTNVKLFSKLNFDNEPLSNNKEILFVYRIYIS